MFANKTLALGCTLAAAAAIACFVPSAYAVVGIGNGHGHHHHHHHHNHHQFRPHFQPHFQQVYKVPVTTVQIVYSVEIRQPNRFGDGRFHQVKRFGSFYQADQFADSLRDRFSGEPGFAVRIDRQRW